MSQKHWIYLIVHVVLVMLGILLCRATGPVPTGIGSSLVAAGVSGWIVFVYVFISARVADRIAILESAGMRSIFTVRSIRIREEYDKRIGKAREGIDLVGFGLRALREDYASDFESWALKAPVRILLLDPGFPPSPLSLAALRDREEGNSDRSIESDVHAFVEACAHLLKRADGRFRVRLYMAMPNINYFRIDDEAFWGPYFVGVQSRNTPTFLIARPGSLFPLFAAHFEQLWSDKFSKDVPTEWY